MTIIGAAATLSERVQGRVVLPDDPSYDEARSVFNAMIDRRPAAIVEVANEADVVTAVGFAREEGLALAIRAGGHHVVGYGVVDDGLVIDLRNLNGIVVDAERRTALVQGGVHWGELDAATQEHGLAVTGGRVTTTGVAGLCLGSGSGWLERMQGLTSDNLVRARVVTADGRVVVASAEENPDLFWALHGGGGNFGIVTEFEFRLQPVGPIVYGGLLAWPRELAGELLRAYRSFMAGAPDEVGGGFAFLTAPPEPFVPVEAQGQPAVGIVVAYFGDPEEGAEAFRPLLELSPVVNIAQPMPYVALQSMLDGGNQPGFQNYWKAEFIDELTDEVVDVLVEHANRISSPLTQLLVLPGGGAYARVDPSATALGSRHSAWNFHALGVWADPAESDTHVAWARDLAAAMAPYVTSGAYPNFASDTGEERSRWSYGDRYDRLVAAKRAWDPDNLFRVNQNIAP
jgi:FAD/FMN-containing dehydrogenase